MKEKQPGSGTESGYNGWKNYETWNIALWISNDEYLYEIARRFRNRGYMEFVHEMFILYSDAIKLNRANTDAVIPEIYYQTPDGVKWNDQLIDITELDKLLEDL